ncbi:hypothetical protein KBD08_03625 [Candidatus Babeliales bacterium]|nr:hypothetical protein [Candidatus Babeliales bacterium]
MQKKAWLDLYQKYMVVMGTMGQLIYYFQAYQIWTTQSCSDVSFFGFLIAFISTASWAVYGFILKNKVLAFAQTVGFIGSLWCLIMILMYR